MVPTDNDTGMFCRTSLTSFVGMLEERSIEISEIYSVTYNYRVRPGCHVVVVGPGGFHLCSCLQLLQHGYPCRHFFACVQKVPRDEIDSVCKFDPYNIHPRWRGIESEEEERWTAAPLVCDVLQLGPGCGQTADSDNFDVRTGGVPAVPAVTDRMRRRAYADVIALLRQFLGDITENQNPSEVSRAVEAMVSAGRREISGTEAATCRDNTRAGSACVPSPPGQVPLTEATIRREGNVRIQNPLPVATKGRRKNVGIGVRWEPSTRNESRPER